MKAIKHSRRARGTANGGTKTQIEAAAIRLFVEKGVTETTVRDIAAAVELSEGALYRHFAQQGRTRLAGLRAALRRVRRRARAARRRGEQTTRGKIAAMIRGFCRAHDDDPTLFRFLLFVQHGQLAQARTRHADAGRRRARRHRRAGSRAGEIPDAGRRSGDRAGLRRRAAAGDLLGLRPPAGDAGADCASGWSRRRGTPSRRAKRI